MSNGTVVDNRASLGFLLDGCDGVTLAGQATLEELFALKKQLKKCGITVKSEPFALNVRL